MPQEISSTPNKQAVLPLLGSIVAEIFGRIVANKHYGHLCPDCDLCQGCHPSKPCEWNEDLTTLWGMVYNSFMWDNCMRDVWKKDCYNALLQEKGSELMEEEILRLGEARVKMMEEFEGKREKREDEANAVYYGKHLANRRSEMKFEMTLRAQYFGPKEPKAERKARDPGLGKEKTDYYEVLGVKRGASVAVCVKAARKRLREVHPDKHPEDRDDEAKMGFWTQEAAKVTEALEVLGDEGKKAEYDEGLQNELFSCIVQ